MSDNRVDEERSRCGYDEYGKHRPSKRIRANLAHCDGCGELIEHDEGEGRWMLSGDRESARND